MAIGEPLRAAGPVRLSARDPGVDPGRRRHIRGRGRGAALSAEGSRGRTAADDPSRASGEVRSDPRRHRAVVKQNDKQTPVVTIETLIPGFPVRRMSMRDI